MFLKLLPDHFLLIETTRNGEADAVHCSVVSLDGDRVVESIEDWSVTDHAVGIDQRFFFIYDQELVSVLVDPITVGVVPRGTFATVWICKGSRDSYIKVSVLNSGYCSKEYPLDWPVNIQNRNQVVPAPILIRHIAGVAGADVNFACGLGVEVEIQNVHGELSVVAPFANHFVFITQLSPLAVTQVISRTENSPAAIGGAMYSIAATQFIDVNTGVDFEFHLNRILLQHGGEAILDVENRNAGDQWLNTDWTYTERILL